MILATSFLEVTTLIGTFDMHPQLIGGRVSEDAVCIVARESNGIQPRVVVLCHLENHAKLQVSFFFFKGQCSLW